MAGGRRIRVCGWGERGRPPGRWWHRVPCCTYTDAAQGAVWCGVVRCGVTARDVEMMDGVVRRGEERDDGGCESVCVT